MKLKYHLGLCTDEIRHYASIGLLQCDNWQEVVVRLCEEMDEMFTEDDAYREYVRGYYEGLEDSFGYD